jgi:hypothetical protein
MLASPVLAEPPADIPGYSLTADSLFEWDPNLFRLPSGASPRQFGQSTDNRGDTIVAPSLSFDANLLPGRQKIRLSAKVDHQWLLKNPNFDVTNLSYGATWQWQLANEWSGELADSQQQQRASFADYRLTQPDRQTTRGRRASVDFRPRPDRRLGVSFNEYVGSNTLGSLQINDYRITVGRAELGLVSGFGSEIVLGVSTTHGSYPNQQIVSFAPVDNSYRQNQLDLSTHYVASEKFQFEVLAGYAKRHYPFVSQRNFGGLVGHLTLDWEPTAKIQAKLGVARDLNSVNDYNRIYTVSTDTHAKLRYQLTFKTQATLEAHATRVRYQGNPQNFFTAVFGPAPYREDRYDSLKFALGWNPSDRLTIQLAQALDARNSNTAGFQYRDWITQLSLEYVIGPWH